MNRSVIFADESAQVLGAMKRIFRKMLHQRDIRFAAGPVEALKQLADQPADVLITAMSFSGQSGTELLENVRKQFPQTVRMTLKNWIPRILNGSV
jgi:DNA-binding NarL/FixJ family response regulator